MDGLGDPAHFNDRLLLGLKGTMSEAELHVMQARMRGGLLSKARRGELQVPIPVGFLYDAQGQVVLDPDQQVQQSIRFFVLIVPSPGLARGNSPLFRTAGQPNCFSGLKAPQKATACSARQHALLYPKPCAHFHCPLWSRDHEELFGPDTETLSDKRHGAGGC